MLMIQSILFLLIVGSILFYLISMYSAYDFFSHRLPVNTTFLPPISILKPVYGLDDGAYENFASFCNQDYPQYQIIFGVQNKDDLAIPVIKKIICDFPGVDIQLIINDKEIGMNPKINNLANIEPHAKYSMLLMSDSDMRVSSDHLRQVVQPMENERVGMVTCPHRQLGPGFASLIEVLKSATEYHAHILVRRKLFGMNWAIGTTIMMRREALQAIGTWDALANYLMDDELLGKLVADKGYEVVLANHIPEHRIPYQHFKNSMSHRLRGLQNTLCNSVWDYWGLAFTFGIVSSLLFLLLSDGSILGWGLLLFTWSTRLMMAWLIAVKYMNNQQAKRFIWLTPISDMISFSVWFYGFFVRKTVWRGQYYHLKKDGTLVQLNEG